MISGSFCYITSTSVKTKKKDGWRMGSKKVTFVKTKARPAQTGVPPTLLFT